MMSFGRSPRCPLVRQHSNLPSVKSRDLYIRAPKISLSTLTLSPGIRVGCMESDGTMKVSATKARQP